MYYTCSQSARFNPGDWTLVVMYGEKCLQDGLTFDDVATEPKFSIRSSESAGTFCTFVMTGPSSKSPGLKTPVRFVMSNIQNGTLKNSKVLVEYNQPKNDPSCDSQTFIFRLICSRYVLDNMGMGSDFDLISLTDNINTGTVATEKLILSKQ